MPQLSFPDLNGTYYSFESEVGRNQVASEDVQANLSSRRQCAGVTSQKAVERCIVGNQGRLIHQQRETPEQTKVRFHLRKAFFGQLAGAPPFFPKGSAHQVWIADP